MDKKRTGGKKEAAAKPDPQSSYSVKTTGKKSQNRKVAVAADNASEKRRKAGRSGKPAFILNANRRNVVARGLLETGNDNWLEVLINGKKYAISKYVRAKEFSFSGGREHFRILDWPHAGALASVTALPDNRSRFGNVEYNNGAYVTFDYRTNTISVKPGNYIVKGLIAPSEPLPNGKYRLSLADDPHKGGNGYEHLTSYAKTWFLINDNNLKTRYFHVGYGSDGCLTVGAEGVGSDDDIRKWTQIAPLLLVQRLAGDENFVGILEVKGR